MLKRAHSTAPGWFPKRPPKNSPTEGPRFRSPPGGKSPATEIPATFPEGLPISPGVKSPAPEFLQTGLGWLGVVLNAVAIVETVQTVGPEWEQRWRRLNESIEANRRPITSCAASSEWALARRKMKSEPREAIERKIAELEALIRRNKNFGDVSSLQSQLWSLQFQLQALGGPSSSPATFHGYHTAIRNETPSDPASLPAIAESSESEPSVPSHRDVSPTRWRIVDEQFKKLLRDHPWLIKAGAKVEWASNTYRSNVVPTVYLRWTLTNFAEEMINSRPAFNNPLRTLWTIRGVLQQTRDVLDWLELQGGEQLKFYIVPGDVEHLVREAIVQERLLVRYNDGRAISGMERERVKEVADVMRLAGRLMRYCRSMRSDDALSFLLLDAAARRYQGLHDTADAGSAEQRELFDDLQDVRRLSKGGWDYSEFIKREFDWIHKELDPWLGSWRRLTVDEESQLDRQLDKVVEHFKPYADMGLYHVAFLGQCLVGLVAHALFREEKAGDIFDYAIYSHERARQLGLLTDADQSVAIDGELLFAKMMNRAGIPQDIAGNVPREVAGTWTQHVALASLAGACLYLGCSDFMPFFGIFL